MRCGLQIILLGVLGVLIAGVGAVWAADPEIDKLLQSPVGKDWVTNGGNMTNERYSTLKQIDTSNVKQLKGAWMTRLKGSGQVFVRGDAARQRWHYVYQYWQ
jgi:glucose dehydrogenase